MAALIDAIDVKRKMFFELDGTPFHCLDVEVNTPTARGGQTLVRLKMCNLLTRAVFDKTFKASDKFKEPDLHFLYEFSSFFIIFLLTIRLFFAIVFESRRNRKPSGCGIRRFGSHRQG